MSASEFDLAAGPVLFVLVCAMVVRVDNKVHLSEAQRCHHKQGEIVSKPAQKNRRERRGRGSEVRVTLTSNVAEDRRRAGAPDPGPVSVTSRSLVWRLPDAKGLFISSPQFLFENLAPKMSNFKTNTA